MATSTKIQEFEDRLEEYLYAKRKFETDGYFLIKNILKRMSQKELANQIGISEVWLSRLINRHRACSVEIYKKLLKV